MSKKFITIGNGDSVAEIMRILKENDATPEEACIEIETSEHGDSYGNTYTDLDIFLVIEKK